MPFEYYDCPACKTRKEVHDGFCDTCGKKLISMFPDDEFCDQFEGSLDIEFIGGYGMYVDGVLKRVIICPECADLLLETFPKLKELLV